MDCREKGRAAHRTGRPVQDNAALMRQYNGLLPLLAWRNAAVRSAPSWQPHPLSKYRFSCRSWDSCDAAARFFAYGPQMGFWRGQFGCLHLYPSSLSSQPSYHHRIRWPYRSSASPPFGSRFGSKVAVPQKRGRNQQSIRSARLKFSCISPIYLSHSRVTKSLAPLTHSLNAPMKASERPKLSEGLA